MNDNPKAILKTAAAAVAALLLGSGCLSVNAGKPERFSKEYCAGERPAKVVSKECVSVEPAVDARQLDKGRLGVGLKGTVETRTERERIYRTLTVERQRKFDFGLFPGLRESADFEGLAPRNDGEETDGISGRLVPMVGASFDPDSKTYVNYGQAGFGWTFGTLLGVFFMTPYAAVAEPFVGDWSCSTHHWILPGSPVGGGIGIPQFYADEGGERKTVLDLISSSPEFEPLGVRTYANSGTAGQSAFASQFTHAALFGFHKCVEVRILPPEITRREPVPGVETRTESRTAVGPFRVRLEIPSLGWSRTEDVRKGRAQAWFDLPAGAGAKTEARIRFEALPGESAETTEELLDKVGGTVFPYVL